MKVLTHRRVHDDIVLVYGEQRCYLTGRSGVGRGRDRQSGGVTQRVEYAREPRVGIPRPGRGHVTVMGLVDDHEADASRGGKAIDVNGKKLRRRQKHAHLSAREGRERLLAPLVRRLAREHANVKPKLPQDGPQVKGLVGHEGPQRVYEDARLAVCDGLAGRMDMKDE